MANLITLALQVLVHAREFPQLDYHSIVETHAPKTVSIGAQRIPEYESIAPVILGAGNAVAVAEAIEPFGVDGVDLEAPVDQSLDYCTARNLDRDGDPARIVYGHLPQLSSKTRPSAN